MSPPCRNISRLFRPGVKTPGPNAKTLPRPRCASEAFSPFCLDLCQLHDWIFTGGVCFPSPSHEVLSFGAEAASSKYFRSNAEGVLERAAINE